MRHELPGRSAVQGTSPAVEHESCDATLDGLAKDCKGVPKIDLFGRVERHGGMLIASHV